MNYSRNMLGVVVLIAVIGASFMAGCAKKKPVDGPGGAGGLGEFGSVLGPMDGIGYEGGMMNPDDLAAVASQFDLVFFDYDSSAVPASERAKVEAVAAYLRANPSVGLIVEGHCDERGSNDYNLALGERRAQAVRAYLVGLGISADRIRTVSYGEERPASMGSNEAAWRQNRRAEFSLY